MRLIPSDTQDLAYAVTHFRVTVGGSVRVTLTTGETRNLVVRSGGRVDLPVVRLHASGTSARGFLTNDPTPDPDYATRNAVVPYAGEFDDAGESVDYNPLAESAAIDDSGTSVSVTFSRIVTGLSSGSEGFTLTGLTGGAVTLTYASGNNTKTVTFTLSRTVTEDETGGLLAYTPGDVVGLNGLPLEAFSGHEVDNGSTVPSAAVPTHVYMYQFTRFGVVFAGSVTVNTSVTGAKAVRTTGTATSQALIAYAGSRSDSAQMVRSLSQGATGFHVHFPASDGALTIGGGLFVAAGDYAIEQLPAPTLQDGPLVLSGYVNVGGLVTFPTGTWYQDYGAAFANGEADLQVSDDGVGGWASLGVFSNNYTLQAGQEGKYVRGTYTRSPGAYGTSATEYTNVVGPVGPLPDPPNLLSSAIDGTGQLLTMVFDRPVTGFTPDASGFYISGVAPGDPTINYVSGDGTDTVVFSINTTVSGGAVVELWYVPGAIATPDGGPLASISNFAVTNGATVDSPQVTQVAVSGGGDMVVFYFNEPVTGFTPDASGFTVAGTGDDRYGAVTLTYVDGDGTPYVQFSASRTIYNGETVTATYTPGVIVGSSLGGAVPSYFGSVDNGSSVLSTGSENYTDAASSPYTFTTPAEAYYTISATGGGGAGQDGDATNGGTGGGGGEHRVLFSYLLPAGVTLSLSVTDGGQAVVEWVGTATILQSEAGSSGGTGGTGGTGGSGGDYQADGTAGSANSGTTGGSGGDSGFGDPGGAGGADGENGTQGDPGCGSGAGGRNGTGAAASRAKVYIGWPAA